MLLLFFGIRYRNTNHLQTQSGILPLPTSESDLSRLQRACISNLASHKD